MNIETEQALERLVACFDDNPEMDAATCIEKWRDARDAERLANEQRMKALHGDVEYLIGRVELVKFKTAADDIVQVPHMVQRLRVKYRDLPDFALQIGVDYKTLLDVLELRRRDVVAHGKMWVSGHPSAKYTDHSAQRAEYRENLRIAAEHEKNTAKRQAELKGLPTKLPEVVAQEWRPKK